MSLRVDGQEILCEGSLLDAVLAAGIDLPHLCKDDHLPAIGACRTCLVEADGRIVAACATPAAGIGDVKTTADRVVRIRRGVLELTAAMQREHPGAGGPHAATTSDAVQSAGADVSRFALRTASHVDTSNVFFSFHEEACILCGRCVVACQALQHISAIGLAGHGRNSRVIPGAGVSFRDSICTSCGSCVAACPTTALSPTDGGSP